MLVDHAWNVMAGGKNDAYAKLKSQNLLAKNVLEPYKFKNLPNVISITTSGKPENEKKHTSTILWYKQFKNVLL